MWKKSFFLLAISSISLHTFSKNIQIGGMGTISTTWLLNSNISNFDQQQDYVFSLAPTYGPSLAFYFTDNIGIELDALFGKYVQKYNGTIATTIYESTTELKTMDFPFLFKFGNDAYFEIGTQFSSIRSAMYGTDNDIVKSKNTTTFPSNGDITNAFNKSNFSFLFGIGGNIELGDKVLLYTGFRFGYGLNDVQGIDAFGNQLNDKNNTTLYNTSNGLYNDYKQTHAVWGNFRFGIAYKFDT